MVVISTKVLFSVSFNDRVHSSFSLNSVLVRSCSVRKFEFGVVLSAKLFVYQF